MKIQDIIEAHHSRLITHQMGDWTVHFDSHLMATIPDRRIPLADVVNIISYACLLVPELKTIPRGKGAYFQDTNTLISIYIRRNQHYPNELTVETVLSPDMRPTPPLFRRSVPPHDMKVPKGHDKMMDYYHKKSQQYGRDAVSQDLENQKFGQNQTDLRPEMLSPEALDVLRSRLNREQRRTLDKYLKKHGVKI